MSLSVDSSGTVRIGSLTASPSSPSSSSESVDESSELSRSVVSGAEIEREPAGSERLPPFLKTVVSPLALAVLSKTSSSRISSLVHSGMVTSTRVPSASLRSSSSSRSSRRTSSSSSSRAIRSASYRSYEGIFSLSGTLHTPTIGSSWLASISLSTSASSLAVSRTRTPMTGSYVGSSGSITCMYLSSRKLALGPEPLSLSLASVVLVFQKRSGALRWPYSNSTYGDEISTARPATMRGCMSRTPTSATSTKHGTISGMLGIGLRAESRNSGCGGRHRDSALLPGDLAAGDLPPSRSPSSSTSFACTSASCCFCRSFLASCSGRSSNETRIVPTGGGFSMLAGSLRWSASASALSGEKSSIHSGLGAVEMPVRT